VPILTWWQAALLVALVTAAGTWLLVVRARLATVRPSVEQTAPPSPETLADGLADLAAVRAEWRAWKKELDAYFEALEDQVDVVERRRRRIASHESKSRDGAAPDASAEPVNIRAAVLQRARAAGHPV
jgi:hypothetical protein